MPSIDLVLAQYQSARTALKKVPSDNSNVAVSTVRNVLHALFQQVVSGRANAREYTVSSSVGEYPLNMAAIPWVAVFKNEITDSARRGFYIVLLFSEDGSNAFLSLNQGITDFQREFGNKTALKKLHTSAGFAAELLPKPAGYFTGSIDLAATGPLGKGYEQAAIVSRKYSMGAQTPDAQLALDLAALLDTYDALHRMAGRSLVSLLPPSNDAEFQDAVQSASRGEPEADGGQDDTPNAQVGPKKRPEATMRQGRETYPRDPNVSSNALRSANFTCALSGSEEPHQTFVSRTSGRPYVEAHHLIPMSAQRQFEYSLDVEENVVPLCPHCHRLVHHGKNGERLKALRLLLSEKLGGLTKRGIAINADELKALYAALKDED